jgi:hypothetical protein
MDWSVVQQRVLLLNITSVNVAKWSLHRVVLGAIYCCVFAVALSPHNSVAAIVCVSSLKRGS